MSVLVVQMGHVGRTSGATGAPGEQELTARIGQACARLLHGRNGWAVRLVGADPPAAGYRGDAFCAFHADGSTNPTVQGASVGWQTFAGDELSEDWATYWTRLGYGGPWHKDNYTKNLAGYYGVTEARRQGNSRAFIAEVGTITNPVDRAYITSQAGVDRAAIALGLALGMTFQEDGEMSYEVERKIDNIHAQMVGDDAKDAEWGATPPDVYPGWRMPDGEEYTLVSTCYKLWEKLDKLQADVDVLKSGQS